MILFALANIIEYERNNGGCFCQCMVSNPVGALMNANYIGILLWSIVLGLALKRHASDHTKEALKDFSEAVSQAVRWIIGLAPFGILALVVDPMIAAICLHRNPYPLVFRCLKESGVTAFFTRSSAANIPINMDGAAITITIMTLAAAHTVGIAVDIPTALVLSVLATLAACGASGVAGGSLLLIPMACSLFGIGSDIAMQVVGVGFIIGVVQDSFETAINSSGDALFAATAEFREWIKEGREVKF